MNLRMDCHLWKLPRWRASLVAQMVKDLPAMQETRVQSPAWEDPLDIPVFLPGEFHGLIRHWLTQ